MAGHYFTKEDKYIDRSYINTYSKTPHTIKNKKLINELTRKAKRILSFEYQNPNYYRQHITDIKNYLLKELELQDRDEIRFANLALMSGRQMSVHPKDDGRLPRRYHKKMELPLESHSK